MGEQQKQNDFGIYPLLMSSLFTFNSHLQTLTFNVYVCRNTIYIKPGLEMPKNTE